MNFHCIEFYVCFFRTGRRVCGKEVKISLILDNACQSPLMMLLASECIEFPSDCCKDLYDRLLNENLETAASTKQHSADWQELRRYRVTGSRCYEIFTYSKGDWEMKAKKHFFPKGFTTKALRHGLLCEEKARKAFIERTGKEVMECGIVISPANKWLGYSPDGVVFQNGKPTAVLEIKCPYEGITENIL